jgi:hypothetical protein
MVPARSLVNGPEQSCVFVAQDGKAVRRAVEVGDRLTELVIIKGGLEEGAKVLVGPVQNLTDGWPLPEYLKASAVPASQPSKG